MRRDIKTSLGWLGAELTVLLQHKDSLLHCEAFPDVLQSHKKLEKSLLLYSDEEMFLNINLSV